MYYRFRSISIRIRMTIRRRGAIDKSRIALVRWMVLIVPRLLLLLLTISGWNGMNRSSIRSIMRFVDAREGDIAIWSRHRPLLLSFVSVHI